ncbi:MAG TPA: tRNA (adenosine(37)-N6)-threonylcarbamoyltransferase complex ATPase subunit type 1 TsaE [Gaiellaceae bacterium]|nr:tRNA (adenosine(37)-N6)-threonylcarbamoyltransferase complex ATPase subunit type 1 TsaE [Gaiellaceae bacterium]
MEEPRLAEHDPAWGARFAEEAPRIAAALGDAVVAVEHVGSTAVPGLAAKPTIDVAAGVRTLDLGPDALRRMAELGYEDAGADSRRGERRFRKGAAFPRELIVHVVVWDGPHWRDLIAFRDRLRADPELARSYEELKRRLLAERGGWYRGLDKQRLIRETLGRPPAIEVTTSSPEETEALAARLARALAPGDVVTVSGELGSGKTTFVRGAARALGVTRAVTSPTFTIGHRYEADPDVSHLDLYRLTRLQPEEWGDLEPYFAGAIAFVEWPEAGEGWLPPARVSVRLRHVDPERRTIELESSEEGLLDSIFPTC